MREVALSVGGLIKCERGATIQHDGAFSKAERIFERLCIVARRQNFANRKLVQHADCGDIGRLAQITSTGANALARFDRSPQRSLCCLACPAVDSSTERRFAVASESARGVG